jgi:hypothetical protein
VLVWASSRGSGRALSHLRTMLIVLVALLLLGGLTEGALSQLPSLRSSLGRPPRPRNLAADEGSLPLRFRMDRSLVPRDRVPSYVRGLKRLERARQEYPLQGNWNALPLWYMSIGLGASNATFPVQVDTGSADLAVVDSSCTGCDTVTTWTAQLDSDASPFQCSANCRLGTCLAITLLATATDVNIYCNASLCGSLGLCGYTNVYGDGSGK